MKINKKLLSLPPYISTSWRDVQAIHQKDGVLIVSLHNGESVQIGNLNTQTIQAIFSAHAAYLDEELIEEELSLNPTLASPIRFSVDSVTNMLQHDSSQAHAPDLPPEMLKKITDVAKIVLPEDPDQLPKAEPHCNCMHCQIAKAIGGVVTTEPAVTEREETVVDVKELTFQQWDITQTGDQLFSVTNRLDGKEQYNVFLGIPIGCTCGHSNCEHLIAVLQS